MRLTIATIFLGDTTLNITAEQLSQFSPYAECHYVDSHYAECRGTIFIQV
jgi:hypothetical protein